MDRFLPLAEEQIFAIGQVACYSACLDDHVERAIWRLLQLSESVGLAVTRTLTAGARVDLLAKVGATQIQDQLAKDYLSNLIRRIEAANTERNNVVHGRWFFWSASDQASGIAKQKLARDGKRQVSVVTYTASRIRDTAAEFMVLIGELQRFFFIPSPGEMFFSTAERDRIINYVMHGGANGD